MLVRIKITYIFFNKILLLPNQRQHPQHGQKGKTSTMSYQCGRGSAVERLFAKGKLASPTPAPAIRM